MAATTHNLKVGDNVQSAINSASKGDTISFGDGLFPGGYTVNKRLTLASTNPRGGIICGGYERSRGIDIATGVSGVVIDGLEVRKFVGGPKANSSSGVRFLGSYDSAATNCIIRNCRVHDCYEQGIYMKGRDNVIENNEIYRTGNHAEAMGIKCEYCTNVLVKNNIIYLCKKEGIRFIDVHKGRADSNVIFMCWAAIAYSYRSYDLGSLNNLLYQCTHGIYDKEHSGSPWDQMSHNTIHTMWRDAIHIGDNAPSVQQLYIYNNIFRKCGQQHIYYEPNNTVPGRIDINGNLYVSDGPQDALINTSWILNSANGPKKLSDIKTFGGYGWEKDGVEANESTYMNHLDGPVAPGSGDSYNTQIGSSLKEPPVNVTLLDISVHSSSFPGSSPSYTPENTTDRKAHTIFRSGDGNIGHQWIIYDLGESMKSWNFIMFLSWEHQVMSAIRQFSFEVSSDRVNWTKLDLYTDQFDGTANNHWWVLSDTQVGRYVRFNMFNNWRGMTFPQGGTARSGSYLKNEYAFADVLFGTFSGDSAIPPPPPPTDDCILDEKFQKDTLKPGILLYTDRDYTITSIPDDYSGLSVIRVPNDERGDSTVSGYVKFALEKDSTVFVAYDSRASKIPDWMDGFTATGNSIETSLDSQPSLVVYKKYYASGDCVDLGGNFGSGSSAENRSNYLVFYGRDVAIPPPPPPPEVTAIEDSENITYQFEHVDMINLHGIVIQFDNDGDFSSVESSISVVLSGNTASKSSVPIYDAVKFLPNGIYYVRSKVHYLNEFESEWSEVISFNKEWKSPEAVTNPSVGMPK